MFGCVLFSLDVKTIYGIHIHPSIQLTVANTMENARLSHDFLRKYLIACSAFLVLYDIQAITQEKVSIYSGHTVKTKSVVYFYSKFSYTIYTRS